MEQSLAVNDKNSRPKVQNVGGDSSAVPQRWTLGSFLRPQKVPDGSVHWWSARRKSEGKRSFSAGAVVVVVREARG